MTLTMLMVVGSFAGALSVSAFDDVVDYQQQINLMSTLKIIEGYADDEFGPDNDVERWHMALWIAKIMTGKVEDAYVNWYSTSNNTDFADLEVDHFYGSISYCNENNVVIGTSATTFEPAKGIMIQDVFTMVVRMLGYGSASMDANYPWSYVDKAIQLGLDADLAEDYNNEDVATREQAAVILYNALFAAKADGTTYAASKFNLTMSTVVLTGTSKANMFAAGDVEAKKLAGENYVAFNELNADGTLGSETFYLLKSEFGFGDELDENLYFGQSYNVITKDNYTTLIDCEAIEGVWFDQTEFNGVTDTKVDLKIDGSSYKAVTAFTYLNNNQGRKTTDNLEIIVYDANNRKSNYATSSFQIDAKNNILGSDGKIAFYYDANLASTATTWLGAYKILVDSEKGTYRLPTQYDWDNAYKVSAVAKAGPMKNVAADYGTNELNNQNAYSDSVLYDDNADGIYDRAMYTYYNFGFISYNDDKHFTINGEKILGDTKYTDASITYVTVDGEVLEAEDVMKALDSSLSRGNYVLYAINKDTKYVIIKEFFTPNQGLVTSIDKPNSTITFDQVYYNVTAGNVSGTKFTLGNSKLPGAKKDDILKRLGSDGIDELQGRNVHYIEKDGKVLAIYEAYNNGGKYFVFDSVVGINSTGYVNALVYNNSNVRTVITIASLQGDWYGVGKYSYTSNADWLNNYGYGELFSYTTDALGNYHVTHIDKDTEYTYYYDRYTGLDNVWVEFSNGIAFPVFNGNKAEGIRDFQFFENSNGVAISFEQFNTNADTVIVVLTNDGILNAFKGIPANNSKLVLDSDETIEVFVHAGDDPLVAKFIYVSGGKFSEFGTINSWNYQKNNTVIFVDKDTVATEVMTNQTSTGFGVTLGTVYTYNTAIDFVFGGVKNNILTYNNRLTAGNFYEIKDAYVESRIDVTDSRIGQGQLVYIDTYEAVLKAPVNGILTEVLRTIDRTNYLYELTTDNDITNVKDETNPKNQIKDFRTAINGYDSFAQVYYYNGELSTPANVFIYAKGKIVAGVDRKTEMYLRNDWIMENVEIYGWDTIDASLLLGSTVVGQITVPYIKGQLSDYQFSGTHGDYGAFNWYEISFEDYTRLSSKGFFNNDSYNYVIRDLGTNMQLIDNSTGRAVQGFNNANVTAFTQIMSTNAGGDKYFLVFTSTPTGLAQRVGGPNDNKGYTLRWVENNSIIGFDMKLDSFGLDPFRYVFVNHNMYTLGIADDSNGLLYDILKELGIELSDASEIYNYTPTLYGNYSEMFTGTQAGYKKGDLIDRHDWKDSFYQYIGLPIDLIDNIVYLINNGAPQEFNLSDYISQLTYRWVGTSDKYDDLNCYNMYLRVPVVDGYKYAITGTYIDDYTDFTGIIKNWELDFYHDGFTATKIDTVWYQEQNHDVYRITFDADLARNIYFSVDYSAK